MARCTSGLSAPHLPLNAHLDSLNGTGLVLPHPCRFARRVFAYRNFCGGFTACDRPDARLFRLPDAAPRTHSHRTLYACARNGTPRTRHAWLGTGWFVVRLVAVLNRLFPFAAVSTASAASDRPVERLTRDICLPTVRMAFMTKQTLRWVPEPTLYRFHYADSGCVSTILSTFSLFCLRTPHTVTNTYSVLLYSRRFCPLPHRPSFALPTPRCVERLTGKPPFPAVQILEPTCNARCLLPTHYAYSTTLPSATALQRHTDILSSSAFALLRVGTI